MALGSVKQFKQEKLASEFNNAKEMKLEVFVTAKTHKEGIPFGHNISERGSWQVLVADFCRKC